MTGNEHLARRTTLGIVLIVVGLFVLVDLALVARVSTLTKGAAAIAAGGFEIFHGLWTREWRGFLSRILLGVLYVGFGVVLLMQPSFGIEFVLYALGLLLLGSGLVRCWMGLRERGSFQWLFVSGLFGIAGGLIILAGWPIAGIRGISVLLGLDLVVHGIAWLAIVWRRD